MKKILMKGNEALAEGAVQGGCQAYFGYPITPQNEIPAYMSRRMPELNRVFIQAESELAAISMVFGASAAGSRTMTSSSSPGISLKQEGISYLAGCQLPCLIVNVQRGGPGLGNIAGAQGDYFQATRGGGHGDYRLIVLAPNSVQEMYDLAYQSFGLADKYRLPALILTDGVIGQMSEPIEIRTFPQPADSTKDWVLDGCRGRERRLIRSLFMGEGELERQNNNLQEKYKLIKLNETRWAEENTEDARIILVAFGIAARIAQAAAALCREGGIKAGLFRPISLFPFPSARLQELAAEKKNFLVVELNAGQMVEDVRLAVEGKSRVEFYGRMGSGIPSAEEIKEKIEKWFL
ncbi:MAG: 3-methyl-2-oxobutanoate dehydrogenase subunit VorB [Elusimicrobiota bacterium]